VQFWRRNQWLEFEWGGWFGVWGRVCQMKLVSWNVRGLGGPKKKREVRSLLNEKSPFIVCL